jgi:hypothetical protein
MLKKVRTRFVGQTIWHRDSLSTMQTLDRVMTEVRQSTLATMVAQ